MKKAFLLSILLCFVLVALAATSALNGQWTGTLRTEDGNQYPLNYNFKVDGDKLTGTVRGPHGDLQINDGQIQGNTFSFDVALDKMVLIHTGKIYPDSIGLDIECDDTKAHTVLKRN
ncbi:hypothetical protein [Mucilaginibacter sp.]